MLLLFDLDNTLCNRLPDNYTEQDIKKMVLLPGVMKFLRSFKGKQVLVTKETWPGLQNKKIDALKIRNCFDLILICSSSLEKKSCFKKVIKKFPHEEIWTIGDRIDSDIRYGQELGLKTVLIKRGKYEDLKPKDPFEIPDYQINTFKELNKVLKCKP